MKNNNDKNNEKNDNNGKTNNNNNVVVVVVVGFIIDKFGINGIPSCIVYRQASYVPTL